MTTSSLDPGRVGRFKRFLVGRPLATDQAHHQLLPKRLALPVFASDALSSVAYATEEILRVLLPAGLAALALSLPIAAVVALLMTIVIASYRQTVRAYPNGGGAYIVTHENLGTVPGLVAAASLLIDYTLTVAVSIAAGAFAIGSLMPSMLTHAVGLSLGFIAIITIANLRGARESGSLFAVPTYAFIVSILTMLAVGATRCALGHCPVSPDSGDVHTVSAVVGMFLILRAFASGATALTGVEAIANGVPAFEGRRSVNQATNAATTLSMLGVIAITMFMGITLLGHAIGVVPVEDRSVVAQIADATFHGGLGLAIVQITTALILVLAANTAYQDFPRLASILAKDRFLPRQFINRGDRLVFSNGILILAGAASALIVVFHADVTRLIQLYVVGVFTSFTLSQIGMVVHWRRLRTGWHERKVVLNIIGAVSTGVVLIVVAATKFMHGAWIVIVAVPVFVTFFLAINRHFQAVGRQLRVASTATPRVRTRVWVMVKDVDAVTLRALGYARSLRPEALVALHVARSEQDAARVRTAWSERVPTVALQIVPGRRVLDAVRQALGSDPAPDDMFTTIVLPEHLPGGRAQRLLQRRRSLLLKAALLFEPGVVVTSVPAVASETDTTRPAQPTRVTAIVLVSAVHNATLRAVRYARALSPTSLRGVTFNVEPSETMQVLARWSELVPDVELEAVDSPYRELRRPALNYIRALRDSSPGTIVSVVIPEFVVKRWWHQFLHNQSALWLKAALLFEPNVVITSVPFHLDQAGGGPPQPAAEPTMSAQPRF